MISIEFLITSHMVSQSFSTRSQNFERHFWGLWYSLRSNCGCFSAARIQIIPDPTFPRRRAHVGTRIIFFYIEACKLRICLMDMLTSAHEQKKTRTMWSLCKWTDIRFLIFNVKGDFFTGHGPMGSKLGYQQNKQTLTGPFWGSNNLSCIAPYSHSTKIFFFYQFCLNTV